MNPLLYGHNHEEGIIAVHRIGDSTMRLTYRAENGIHYKDDNFYPFFFLADRAYLEGFEQHHWIKELTGGSHFRYVCAFDGWSALWDAVRLIIERYNRKFVSKIDHYSSLDIISLVSDPVTQYLLQTGRTLFKGMEFSDLHRLQLDIETYSPVPGRFGSAVRPSDRIILIALSDNTGWNHLVDGKTMSEQEMLQETVRLILERDPDVIEGHNICEFDFPYLLKRCELHGISFTIGRDGSVPYSAIPRYGEAARPRQSPITDVGGRQIVDTLLLVRNYDQTKHVMESHSLKYAAQFFGVAPPARTYISGERISWHWDHDPDTLRNYAMDDVREIRAIGDHLLGTYFYLAQILPMNLSSAIRSGSASKIENLMVREYLRQRIAVPKPQTGFQTTGGYTDIFAVGILGPVLHVDIESLYPSIMVSKSIRPRSDELGVFTELLRELTNLRIETKHRMQRTADARERSRLDAMQSSLKILINSFYGYLGYDRGLFNDHQKADEVTRSGQELLHLMISTIRQQGGLVVEVDTDGIFFVPPSHAVTEQAEEDLVAELSRRMPEGITVTLDGRYRKMLSYKKKNYALLSYDNKLTVKGSSLTSRSIEHFGRAYIRTCISCLLCEDIPGLHQAYVEMREKIAGHRLSVRDFARTEALSETLAEYRSAVESGRRTRSAPYEIALTMGRPIRRSERISYYVTGDEPNPRTFENCKPASEWDPNFPDENIPYYIRRLDEFSEKFQPFFTPQDFRKVFSVEDLFPFSPEGITILSPDVSAVETRDEA